MKLTSIPQLRGAISLFMGSPDTNSKFVGLGLLIKLPDFADEFQTTIIDCLEHPDPTIRLRTLALLHAMANEGNAQIIVLNMLRFFQRTKNERVRIELADRITSIASRFSPSPLWFAKTMEQLFSLGGSRVRPEIAFQVIRLIQEECDEEMRRSIVNLYIDVALSGRRLSDVFVTVIACVVGKYGNISQEYDLDYIALLLCDLADAYEGPRDWILNALLQVVSQLEGDVPQQVLSEFETYKRSRAIIVQEICYEALALLNYRDALKESLADPDDEIEFEEGLPFLDTIVQESIDNGLPDYIPIEDREDGPLDLSIKAEGGLKYQPYQAQHAAYSEEGIVTPEAQEDDTADNGLDTSGVRSVWTNDGYTAELGAEEEQPEAPAAAASTGAQTAYGTSVLSAQPQSLFQQLQLHKKAAPAVSEKERTKAKLFNRKPAPQEQQPAAAPAPQQPQQPQTVRQLSQEEAMAELRAAEEALEKEPPEAIAKAMDNAGVLDTYYQDPTIVVSGKVLGGTVILGVRNMGGNPIFQASVRIAGPQQLVREEVSFPEKIGAIPPGATVYSLVTFKFPNKLPQWPDMNRFAAQVIYDGKAAGVKLPMNLLSFVLPLQGTTQMFGQLWKSGGCEVIYTMAPGVSMGLDDVCEGLRECCHMKTVQRIGTEEIFLGGLFSTPFKILMHVKFNPQKTEIKVLTKAPPLTQALVAELKNIFG